MTSIIEAVNATDATKDRLYQAACTINEARCLPQATKDALIKHISDARAKHPATEEQREDKQPAISPTRPSRFSAAVAKSAKKAAS